MRQIILALLLTTGLYAAEHSAKVLESLQSGGYTYIKVEEGSETYWIAMTRRDVAAGETITYKGRGWQRKFYSKILDRTFDKVLFASDIPSETVAEERVVKPDVMTSSYQQTGTITVAELFSRRHEYSGKKVRVRGKVTKTSAQIMRKNWVHLQDGSSFQGADDLVFTTQGEMPPAGSVVTAEGVVASEKDFGYGYFYPVIVEKSSFSQK